jgi:hypothetical protein
MGVGAVVWAFGMVWYKFHDSHATLVFFCLPLSGMPVPCASQEVLDAVLAPLSYTGLKPQASSSSRTTSTAIPNNDRKDTRAFRSPE